MEDKKFAELSVRYNNMNEEGVNLFREFREKCPLKFGIVIEDKLQEHIEVKRSMGCPIEIAPFGARIEYIKGLENIPKGYTIFVHNPPAISIDDEQKRFSICLRMYKEQEARPTICELVDKLSHEVHKS